MSSSASCFELVKVLPIHGSASCNTPAEANTFDGLIAPWTRPTDWRKSIADAIDLADSLSFEWKNCESGRWLRTQKTSRFGVKPASRISETCGCRRPRYHEKMSNRLAASVVRLPLPITFTTTSFLASC